MDKLIEQAIKNCKITKYEMCFKEVCEEYKRLLDAEQKTDAKQENIDLEVSVIENFLKPNCVPHANLKKGNTYWVFIEDRWQIAMVYAPFKAEDFYFRFLNGMHVECKTIKEENIQNLFHYSFNK
jgi:hypothetical protein